MLDNLALDIANSSVQARMNRFNTNAARATLQRLFGVISPRDPNTNPNGQYPTAAVVYADNNNYYSIPKIAVSGLCSSDGCVDSPTSGEWNSNALLENDLTGISGRIGMYYNYCAISAGSYCYGNGTSDTGSPTSDPDPNSLQDIKEDICPKGWRLPTGGGNGEYLSLYNQYASASPNQETAFQSAFHIILSGSFISGHSSSQGGVNKLPTSTWASDSNVVLLWSDNRYDSMNYAENRSNGHSVRCIFNSQ